ncbi:MAG: CHAT domain-containing protein [Deltaproteobacteria bacterium]|nr:CHAT domain-containing protein [Deltaproteobacteria bacterium]
MRSASASVFLILLLCPGASYARESPEHLRERALAHYGRAKLAFGVAMGGRASADPALPQLLAEVAEMLCLQGDLEGCLSASREAGRALGAYSPLATGELHRLDRAQAFLAELHSLSEGWAFDASLASEGAGLVEQALGDRCRQGLAAALKVQLDELGRSARKMQGRASVRAWAEAVRIAWQMLDQAAAADAAVELGRRVHETLDADGSLGTLEKDVVERLALGRKLLAILGRSAQAKELEGLLARLETKAGPPAELSFELAPLAEGFRSDLGAARSALAELAVQAPLRSRPSLVLHFLAAYAGVIDYEPEAAADLAGLRDAMAASDPYLASRALGLLGRHALLQGDYYLAADMLKRSVEELGGGERTRGLRGLLLANRAQALSWMGEYADAAAEFARAAGLLADRKEARFQCLLGRAHCLIFAGELSLAERQLEEAGPALAAVPESGRAALGRALELDRALWLLNAGRADEALEQYRRVAEAAIAASDVKAGAIARCNMAEIENDRGQAEQGLKEAQAALKWIDPESQADAAWQALCEEGRALAALGRRERARRSFARAVELVDHLRARIGAEGSRRSFSAAKTRLFAHYVSVLVDERDSAGAFQVSERARGRAFLDMLAERPLKLGRAQAQARLASARDRLLRSLPPVETGFSTPGTAAGARRKPAAPGDLTADPALDWTSLVSARPATLRQVQHALGSDEALLSFFHDGKRLLAFLVTRDAIRLGQTEMSAERLAQQTKSLLRSLSRPDSRERKLKRKARRLYQSCFESLGPAVKARRLVVVPWGPLHYIPFAALWDGDRYLVDRFELASVPSASALVMIRKRIAKSRRTAPRVLALANPATELPALPAAEAEAALLGKLFAGSEIRMGRRATREAFVDGAPGASHVHLASHGVFVPERPMDSYLALSGGKLKAIEILGVDLGRARMVVLSACHSGEAQVQRGDELVGLSRAFLHAGSSALLASMWTLADQSGLEISRQLYRGVQEGLEPAAALSRAIRQVKRDERFTHPYFWAPLELIGS